MVAVVVSVDPARVTVSVIVVPDPVTVTLPSVIVTVRFLTMMADTTSVIVLNSVAVEKAVEKAVMVAVMFLYPIDAVEQGKQVEFLVGCGQPLVPVPWLIEGSVRVRFMDECEWCG